MDNPIESKKLDVKNIPQSKAILVGGIIFIVIIIVIFMIAISTAKPKKNATFPSSQESATPLIDPLQLEDLRAQNKELKQRLESNTEAFQKAFKEISQIVDKQSLNISILNTNINILSEKIKILEASRLNSRVRVIKPGVNQSSSLRGNNAQRSRTGTAAYDGSIDLASDQVQAVVGNRAWVKNGNEEYNVGPGDAIPPNGQLVINQITNDGRVSVNIESEPK